jgi:flavin-dependent dehydrogenase
MAKAMNIPISEIKTNRRTLFTRVVDEKASLFKNPKQITFEIIAKDLWFWVIPFSTGETSIGFVGDDSFFKSDKGSLLEFDEMLEKSIEFSSRFSGLKHLFEPVTYLNFSNSIQKSYGDRFVITGNSLGFLDPVFSSGVAIATESGLLAAKLIEKELSGEMVDWEKDYAGYMKRGLDVFINYIDAWYNGGLQSTFFYKGIQEATKRQIISVLAGYVWDLNNPFVKNHKRLLSSLIRVVQMEKN